MPARLKTKRSSDTSRKLAAGGNGQAVHDALGAAIAAAGAKFPLRRKVAYQSLWVQRSAVRPSARQLEDALSAACLWLSEKCLNRDDALSEDQNPYRYPYLHWRGVAREYHAGTRQWRVFGPLWHTGQAAKALVMAHDLTGQSRWLDAARLAGDFLMKNRVCDRGDPQFGFIPGYENADATISASSCMLEALDGLFYLGRATGDPAYTQSAVDCLDWATRRMYLPDEALFLDDWIVAEQRAATSPNTRLHNVAGRPLIDDSIYFKAYQVTRRQDFLDIFRAVAERLLSEESPAGNWIAFPPCDQVAGAIHPRQAFWWGLPMIDAWQHFDDPRYLACARRAADWYVQAQRADGGMFRFTSGDFRTTSFSQASSGIFCAALLWTRLILLGQGDEYRQPLRRAIQYGLSVQFTRANDPNLRGALIESVDPPDGGDALPYNVRDLASIFFIQALAGAMRHGLV